MRSGIVEQLLTGMPSIAVDAHQRDLARAMAQGKARRELGDSRCLAGATAAHDRDHATLLEQVIVGDREPAHEVREERERNA